MDEMKPVSVVVVGCGGMAHTWVALAVAHERIKVVGLVDMRREAAEAMAEKHGLDESVVFESIGAAVESTGAEAVFDVTVPPAHRAVVTEALGLGCHVLGEKPMAESAADAAVMVEAQRASGKVYAVTQTRRPLDFAVRSAGVVSSGVIGAVRSCHSDFFIGARFGGDARNNFRNTMDQPLLKDMAIHTFDNARQITGGRPVSVWCESWNPEGSWYDGDGSAVAVFEMADAEGRPFKYVYRGSWCSEGANTSWAGDWRVVGTKGTLVTDGQDVVRASLVKDPTEDAFIRELEEVDAEPAGLELSGHEYLIDEFVRVLRDGAEPMCPAADNYWSVAMVDAAARSAETGQRVEIEAGI
ncbi:MAG: Gfo/Idh/MocA family oxidoreductase [Planctomycetota bacterium]